MTMPISRVLLLGHEGFIGRRVWAAFAECPPEVELLGRSHPAFDLTERADAGKLVDLVDEETAVVVLSGIKRQLGDTLDIFEKNMAMVVNLCRVLEERPAARVVYLSSSAVYGEEIHNVSITEETPVRPSTNYGIAKYACERLLDKVVHRSGQGSLVVLRPPVVYGPGDAKRTYGPSAFAHAAATGEKVILWGDGSELREFVFVDDVAEVVRRLSFSDFHGVVNLVTGTSYSFREALDIALLLAPEPFGVDQRPRTRDKVDHVFTGGLCASLVPDFEFTSLEEGTRRTFEAEREAALAAGAGS
jgi:UDP-glucose 4-epimerase